mgnify:CR=1 FL=1
MESPFGDGGRCIIHSCFGSFRAAESGITKSSQKLDSTVFTLVLFPLSRYCMFRPRGAISWRLEIYANDTCDAFPVQDGDVGGEGIEHGFGEFFGVLAPALLPLQRAKSIEKLLIGGIVVHLLLFWLRSFVRLDGSSIQGGRSFGIRGSLLGRGRGDRRLRGRLRRLYFLERFAGPEMGTQHQC